jgi:hypothetical protein
LREQFKNVSRERHTLTAEMETIKSGLAASEINEADRQGIRESAISIRDRMKDPTFEQKHALFDMLDVQVELKWKDGERGIQCTCGLNLTQNGEKKPIWIGLTRVGGKLSSRTTTSHLMTL